jgi:3-methyladenine DNA glycosylase/8-oxoguanine DNA glycosylase
VREVGRARTAQGDTRGRARLDAQTLARASRSLAAADRRLGRLLARLGPCGLSPGRQPDHLSALVRSIVFQQLSGKAASTIFGRLVAALPGTREVATPEDWLSLDEPRLRAAGLSRQKIGYLRDLCERVRDGRLDLGALEQLDDDAVTEQLVAVKGFGRWSAHMVLIFHLGRPDVWPADDLGIRKAVARLDRLSELPAPRAVESRADRWRPWRSVAAWYLWRSLEVSPGDAGW